MLKSPSSRRRKPTEIPDNLSDTEADQLRSLLAQQSAQIGLLTTNLQALNQKNTIFERLLRRSEDLEAELLEIRLQQDHSRDVLDDPQKAAYLGMTQRVREAVRRHTPQGAHILMVSKGDNDLLRLPGRMGLHFPPDASGGYAGFHPNDSLSAIAQLSALRWEGAEFFVLPATSFWWRERYSEFYHHLHRWYRAAFHDEQSCIIFSLNEPGPWRKVEEALGEARAALGRDPVILDFGSGASLNTVFSELTVFSPPELVAPLPYMNRTIDFVAVPTGNHPLLLEARRVASTAVIQFDSTNEGCHSVSLEWQNQADSTLSTTVSIILDCRETAGNDLPSARAFAESLPHNFNGEILLVGPHDLEFSPSGATSRLFHSNGSGLFLPNPLSAAQSAKGDILVFMPHNLAPLPNWLSPLLETFAANPKVGVIGGRCFRPDGSLSEAGGTFNPDGTFKRFGEGDFNVAAPRYKFRRKIDFCSDGALAVRTHLFRKISLNLPSNAGEFQRTLCREIARQGADIFYQPESAVVQLGITRLESTFSF